MTTDSPQKGGSLSARWPLLAVAGVVVLLLAGWFLIPRGEEKSPGSPRGGGKGQAPDQLHPAGRPIDQAPWRIRAYPAGAISKTTARQHRRIETQRRPLVQLVKTLFDTRYFSAPGAARPVAEKSFTASAARRWLAAETGPPRALKRLRTVVRSAEIGVDARTARRAAAAVRIVAFGRVTGRRTKFTEETTLWLERARKRWRVIAFSTGRRPLPQARQKERRSGGKKAGADHKKRDKSPGGSPS